MSHFNVEDIDKTQSMASSPPFKEDVEDAILVTAQKVLCGHIRVVPLQKYEEYVKLKSNKGCSSVEIVKENHVNGAELCPNENNVKEADNISNEACFDESLLEVEIKKEEIKEEEITIEETCILEDENQYEEKSDDGFPTEVDKYKNEVQSLEGVKRGGEKGNMCRKSFKTEDGLNKHVLIHSEGNHLCEVCGIPFKTISGLRKHFPVHKISEKSNAGRKIDKRNYVPEICKEPLESQTGSVKVVSAQFGNKTLNAEERFSLRSYVCKICRRWYHTSSSLAKHVLTHSERKIPESDKQEGEMIHNVNNMPGTKKEDRKRSVCNMKRKSFETTDDSSKDFLIHTRNRPSYTETEIRSTRNVRTIERNSCETSNNRVTRSTMHSENKIVNSEKDTNKNKKVDTLYGKSFESPKVFHKRSLIQAGTELSSAKMEFKNISTRNGIAGKKEIERNYTESEPQNAEEKIRKRRGVYKVCNTEERSLIHMEGGTVNAEVEVGKRSRKCSICRKSFNNSGGLFKHFLTHIKNVTLVNVKEEEEGSSPIENEVPEVEEKASETCVVHKIDTKPYISVRAFAKQSLMHTEPIIPNADKEFDESTRLLTPSGSHKYSCEYCNKSFPSLFRLKKHISIHTGERPYKCDKCDKSFKEKCHLKTHEDFIHTDKNSYAYKCKLCQKIFVNRFYLAKHERTHTDERPYKCMKCKKTFRQSHSLKAHSFVHTSGQLFECEECKKKFKHPVALHRHLRVHKPFRYVERHHKCKFCPKKFANHYVSLIHERTHTNERPYKCKKCKKTFKQSQHLKAHSFLHTRGRSFECDACKKKFKQPSALHRHLRIHLRRNEWIPSKEDFKGFKGFKMNPEIVTSQK